MWYIIIAVLAVLIIIALLGFCFILGRRREKSNAELIKDANARERIKENEYVKEQYSQELKCRGPNPVSMISNDLVLWVLPFLYIHKGYNPYYEERKAASKKYSQSNGGLHR